MLKRAGWQRPTQSLLELFSTMSSHRDTWSVLMRSLIEANESVEEWKESSCRMENSRDSRGKMLFDAEKKCTATVLWNKTSRSKMVKQKNFAPNIQKKLERWRFRWIGFEGSSSGPVNGWPRRPRSNSGLYCYTSNFVVEKATQTPSDLHVAEGVYVMVARSSGAKSKRVQKKICIRVSWEDHRRETSFGDLEQKNCEAANRVLAANSRSIR